VRPTTKRKTNVTLGTKKSNRPHISPPNMTTTNISEGRLEAVSTVLEAWRSSPGIVTEEGCSSSLLVDKEESDLGSILLDDEDKDYFCPLPEASSARAMDHWDILSSGEKRYLSLKQTVLHPLSSLDIPPPPLVVVPRSVPDPIKRTRPCCLFINYLGTRLPQPKPCLSTVVTASSKLAHNKPTSTPAANPSSTLAILVAPNLTIALKTTSPKAVPFPINPAHHMCPCKKIKPPLLWGRNLKVPIHLTNLKLPAGAVGQEVQNKKHKGEKRFGI
jgi:hypothetical protein